MENVPITHDFALLSKEELNLDLIQTRELQLQYKCAVEQLEIEKELVKQHEAIIENFKKNVQKVFEECHLAELGLKKIEKELLTITYVNAKPDEIVFDEKQFKECCPEDYQELLANFNKKKKGAGAYVKITIKKDKD